MEESSSASTALSWHVRYQLESSVSMGCLSEFDIDETFLLRLRSVSEKEAQLRLEAAVDAGKRLFDPMQVFRLHVPRSLHKQASKMPRHCVLQRSATITPSSMYLSTPTVEVSNRVLRKYAEYSDRFLRVRFVDDRGEHARIFPTKDSTQNTLYTRIFQCLTQGIRIGERHFELLACGNSQFRENGAYFFSPPAGGPSTEQMRRDMGSLDHIDTISKYNSRLGQCFSTTRSIRSTRVEKQDIPDVERNGCNFTDGNGKLSGFLARLIAGELGLEEPPSLFQFRMGGAKGIVAVAPDVSARAIQIRPSQEKFDTVAPGLEIIRWSCYSVPRLNRQLILVLKALDIQDDVLHARLTSQLDRIDAAMTDEQTAIKMLLKQIDQNRVTLELASIVQNGFVHMKDPFALSMLRLWRSWSLKLLKEKAAIPIEQGAFLLGCSDETATLTGYFRALQPDERRTPTMEQRIRALPEIFVQISDPDRPGSFKVIDSICIVARNPSLHPGDIRVVRAVDKPALRHLKDVVVFPQTGDCDIPSMCSGGDLDGDDFVVIWDQDLIPFADQWNVKPMDFTAPKRLPDPQVGIREVAKYFIHFMRNDNLRTIATWHLANADRLVGGVKHARCKSITGHANVGIELANQHSLAVDFAKSGTEPQLKPEWRPSQFPHYIPSQHRPKSQIYTSTSIVGQLYDRVPDYDFSPLLDVPFNETIMNAYDYTNEILVAVEEIKADYDAAVRRIMAQHEIATEFEVWSTWVMHHAKLVNDYKINEEVGRLSSALKEHYSGMIQDKAGGKSFEKLAPWVGAMYTVTAREAQERIGILQMEQHHGDQKGELKIDAKELPLISFPWMFHNDLGRIANGGKRQNAVIGQDLVSKEPHNVPKKVTNVLEGDLVDLSFEQENVHNLLAPVTRAKENEDVKRNALLELGLADLDFDDVQPLPVQKPSEDNSALPLWQPGTQLHVHKVDKERWAREEVRTLPVTANETHEWKELDLTEDLSEPLQQAQGEVGSGLEKVAVHLGNHAPVKSGFVEMAQKDEDEDDRYDDDELEDDPNPLKKSTALDRLASMLGSPT